MTSSARRGRRATVAGGRLRATRFVAALAVLSLLVFSRPSERAPVTARPPLYPIAADAEAERTHASANFTVTWIHDGSSPDAPSLRDKDGNAIPDSVESLLAAFESARGFLLGRLGYSPPPVAGPLRLYVADREEPAETKLAPGGQGSSRPSFIIMSTNTLRPLLQPRHLRTIAVHEYFHAIQNGYDSEHEHWIGEASATWVEDVFDDPGDPNHDVLEDFVPYPRLGLTDSTDEHEYGAFLFLQFLVERYADGSSDLVRELWENIAVPEAGGPGLDALGAVEAVLARRGVAFQEAWREFLLWRWDLDRFEEGEAYLDVLGDDWPKPLQNTEVAEESCRLSSDLGTGLPPLSGDYSVFRPADTPARANATVTLEGPEGATGFLLVQKQGGKERVKLLDIGEDGLASSGVRFGQDRVKRVVLGVGNAARAGTPASLGYSLRIPGRSAVEVEPLGPPAETHLFGGLTLRGRVLCGGQPAALADVALFQDKRSGEQRTFSLATDVGGIWSRTFEPEETSTYHVAVLDPLLSEAQSQPWDVGVLVALDLEAPDPEVTLGEPATVVGRMAPPHPGAVVLIEYRRPELSWRAGPQTTPDQDGNFRAEVVLPATGIWHLRASVVTTGDDDHLGNTTAHDVFVNVT